MQPKNKSTFQVKYIEPHPGLQDVILVPVCNMQEALSSYPPLTRQLNITCNVRQQHALYQQTWMQIKVHVCDFSPDSDMCDDPSIIHGVALIQDGAE